MGSPNTLTVPLHIYVAKCGPEKLPVRPEAWVKEHVAAAQTVLLPHEVRLSASISAFHPQRCELLGALHRDAMAKHVTGDNVVPVLLVQRVRDLDVLDYDLMGVHWRYAGKEAQLIGRRWIFLTSRAQPPVLAHELCHFFGLPHDPGGGNLMTPGPSAPASPIMKSPRPFKPLLTPAQATALRAGIQAWAAANGA